MNQSDFNDSEYLEEMKQKKTALNHIHWDGSIPTRILFAEYHRRNILLKLPSTHLDGSAVQQDRIIDSVQELEYFFNGLLSRYRIEDIFTVPIKLMQTEKDLKKMALLHAEYLKSQNVVYAETRFAPAYHTKEGLSLDQVIGYSLEGFAKASEETGVNMNLIVCINRETDVDSAEKIVRAALNFEGKGVVGVDIAGYEVGNPPEKFYKPISKTFESNLKRTIHAGEMVEDELNSMKNIYTSITHMRANGIAHAIHLHKRFYKKHDLIELMIENDIRLESNPISNYHFFIDEIACLHLDELVNAGVKVTINPDDPEMWSQGDMAHNLYVVGKLYGIEFVDKVIKNSFDTAWNLN